MAPTRIVELAAITANSTKALDEILASKGYAEPSFAENAQLSIPEEASSARDTILDATSELHEILLEPPSLLLRVGAVSFPCSYLEIC